MAYQTYNAAFKVAGTISFRLASTQFLKPKGDKGYGGNLQNIPDSHRRAFVPRPSFTFIQCDLEGAEAVVVALLCVEGQFRQLIRRKVKPHNFLCVKIFPSLFQEWLTAKEIEELTPDKLADHSAYKAIISKCKSLPKEYALAKRTVHGSNYMMGWRTFMENVLKETAGQVVLTAKESKNLLDTYFLLFPEVKLFQAMVENTVKSSDTLFNLFGEPFTPIARFTTDLVRKAVSWIPQSTVGQCSNRAAVKLQAEIEHKSLPWNLLNIVHDSLLVECPTDYTEICAVEVANCLTYTFESPLDNWRCTIGVEKQAGMNWGKYHEMENPNGLKVI